MGYVIRQHVEKVGARKVELMDKDGKVRKLGFTGGRRVVEHHLVDGSGTVVAKSKKPKELRDKALELLRAEAKQGDKPAPKPPTPPKNARKGDE